MGQRPGKLQWERHVALGEQLFEISDMITRLYTELSNTYDRRSRAVAEVKKAHIALSQLRSALDDRLAVEYDDGFVPHIYYPGSSNDPAREYRELFVRDRRLKYEQEKS